MLLLLRQLQQLRCAADKCSHMRAAGVQAAGLRAASHVAGLHMVLLLLLLNGTVMCNSALLADAGARAGGKLTARHWRARVWDPWIPV